MSEEGGPQGVNTGMLESMRQVNQGNVSSGGNSGGGIDSKFGGEIMLPTDGKSIDLGVGGQSMEGTLEAFNRGGAALGGNAVPDSLGSLDPVSNPGQGLSEVHNAGSELQKCRLEDATGELAPAQLSGLRNPEKSQGQSQGG